MFSLNLLLSSSNFPVFFLHQFFLFDFFEKLTISNFEYFCNYFIRSGKPFMKIKLEVALPSSNDLSKFRNRILILLYYFVFELLVGFKPRVIPLLSKKNELGIDKDVFIKGKETKFISFNNKIGKFILQKDLNFFQSSLFLTFISCFLSKHSFSGYTVPSKLLKLDSSINSYSFNLGPGLSSFEFLSQFDDFALSRVFLSFSFVKVKFLPNQVFDYYLSAIGLNLFKSTEIAGIIKNFNLLDLSTKGSGFVDRLISIPAV